MRSKDPSTQVGACIVNNMKKIVGIGYNGLPNGIDDDLFPWSKDGDFLETKYPYVCHAELNAILNSIQTLNGCTIYVTLFPCNECTKAIIQSGIKTVYYLEDRNFVSEEAKASLKMLAAAKIEFRKITTKNILKD
ncbi:MAG: deoxycytidylate deaminase [Mycoplasmatales bacterium]